MAGYRYEFDTSKVGDARYDRGEYETVQDALKVLEAQLSAWNQVAMDNGALEVPYAREVKDLQNIIEWGEERLSNKATDMGHDRRGLSRFTGSDWRRRKGRSTFHRWNASPHDVADRPRLPDGVFFLAD